VENTLQAEVVFSGKDLGDMLDSVQAALNDKLDNLLADAPVAQGNRLLWLKWQSATALELHPSLWQRYMRMSFEALEELSNTTKELNSAVIQAPPSTPRQHSVATRAPLSSSPRKQVRNLYTIPQYASQQFTTASPQQVYSHDMPQFAQMSSAIQVPQQPQRWVNIPPNMMPPPPPQQVNPVVQQQQGDLAPPTTGSASYLNISGIAGVSDTSSTFEFNVSQLYEGLDNTLRAEDRSLNTPPLPQDDEFTAKDNTGTDNTPTGDNNNNDKDKDDKDKDDKDSDNNV
jgi:hypothetical protein